MKLVSRKLRLKCGTTPRWYPETQINLDLSQSTISSVTYMFKISKKTPLEQRVKYIQS